MAAARQASAARGITPGTGPGAGQGIARGTGLVLLGRGGASGHPHLLRGLLRDLVPQDARRAGPTTLTHATLEASRAAQAIGFVWLLPDPANFSGPWYRVHPRRSNRFVAPGDRLRGLFPEIDFTEFIDTGALLRRLAALCPERFALVAEDQLAVWADHLRAVLPRLPARGVMLCRDHDCGLKPDPRGLWQGPVLRVEGMPPRVLCGILSRHVRQWCQDAAPQLHADFPLGPADDRGRAVAPPAPMGVRACPSVPARC
jgi:hypothetical protein